MYSLVVKYTIFQLEEAFFNRYDLVSCKTCEMQQSIYYFFTGKSTEKGDTMKWSQPPKIKMATILLIHQIKIMTKHAPDINS